MKATIAYWNLDNSQQTIQSLRHHLQEEGTDLWEKIPGMKLKFWICDPVNNLWGAVMLWESSSAMTQPLPPNRALELIGYQPQFRLVFDVAAITKGN